MRATLVFITLIASFPLSVLAQYCNLIGAGIFAQDKQRTFLGIISTDTYEFRSIMNEVGLYGSSSTFRESSIFNPEGFGDESNPYSPFNEHSEKPPLIISTDSKGGVQNMGLLTRNPSAPAPAGFEGLPKIDPDALIAFLRVGDCKNVKFSAVRLINIKAEVGHSFQIDALGREFKKRIPAFNHLLLVKGL